MIYNAGNRSEMQTRQANIFCIIHVILGDRYSPEFLKLLALVRLIAKHPTSLAQLEARQWAMRKIWIRIYILLWWSTASDPDQFGIHSAKLPNLESVEPCLDDTRPVIGWGLTNEGAGLMPHTRGIGPCAWAACLGPGLSQEQRHTNWDIHWKSRVSQYIQI